MSSPSLHSPQDSSRVLFNERSNRLEPYSSSRFGGPSRDSYFGRRGSRADGVISPTESRNGRDGPFTQGVQLLQKPAHGGRDNLSPEERGPRSRMSGDRPNFAPQHDVSSRDRDMSRRDYGGPSHMTRTTSRGFDNMRSRDAHDHPGATPDRARRTSNTGPPFVSSPSDIARDGRQLPPHLTNSHQQPGMWRTPSTASRPRRQSTTSSVGGPPSQHPVQSPVSPHAVLSPSVADASPQSVPSTPNVDIDEVRKAAMHSAAERARLRRQQEEAEREKERERARQKAAELEAKINAAEEEKVKRAAELKTEDDTDDQKGALDSEVCFLRIGLCVDCHLQHCQRSSQSSRARCNQLHSRRDHHLRRLQRTSSCLRDLFQGGHRRRRVYLDQHDSNPAQKALHFLRTTTLGEVRQCYDRPSFVILRRLRPRSRHLHCHCSHRSTILPFQRMRRLRSSISRNTESSLAS